MDDVLRVIGGFGLFALALGFWAFTLLFHVLSDWKESSMGRHFMSFMSAGSLSLGWAFFGFSLEIPETLRAWVRVILYCVLAFIVWRQVRMLIRIQIIARNRTKVGEVPQLANVKETPHGDPVA